MKSPKILLIVLIVFTLYNCKSVNRGEVIYKNGLIKTDTTKNENFENKMLSAKIFGHYNGKMIQPSNCEFLWNSYNSWSFIGSAYDPSNKATYFFHITCQNDIIFYGESTPWNSGGYFRSIPAKDNFFFFMKPNEFIMQVCSDNVPGLNKNTLLYAGEN